MATNDLSKAGHNFTCFAKVCVDLMKLPLIDVLKLFIKPQDLHTNIQNSSLTTGKNKLRQDQLKICFIPPPGKPNYNDFDVTLLYTLTRNLCPLLTPTQGWGIEPRTTDTLIGDDIERLRLFRNNYYGHADSTEISDVEFEDLWKHVKSTIRRIGNYTNSSYEQEFNKIEMCRFGYHDLEKYKLLLEAALEFSKQLNNKDKTDISIKGENEVICGKIARFLVDVNPAERPNSLVTWQKVRGRVIEQIDTSREKYRGSYDKQLVINSVCKEDEGEYQAVLSQLSNGMKKTFSNLIFLFPLGEPPCFDVWKVTTSSEEITINYSYVVPESSPKVQKIQWSRDGTILNLKNTKYDGGGLTDSSLTIMSPNEEDKGNYSCTVSNAVGSVTNNLMFDVPKAKLKLSTEFSKDEVFFGSKVILNSEVSSCPSLDGVKWQASIDAENFTCIDISEQRYVGSQDNPECPLLVIPKITFEDIFYYRLLVWNKIGKVASNSLRLNVTGSPPNVLTNHEIYIEDQSVRLIGKVFVNKMLPAIKTIYWTKDGKKLEMEDGGEKYSEVNTRNPSLTIRNVNQHDAGTYRLTATNAVGTTSSEIVLDLPSICVERSENPDGSQSYTAMIDSVPAAYRAQWNVKDTDNDTFTPIDVTAEVYKGTSNSLPCPVLVVKRKELSENKCFQIEVQNFVGRSITEISGNDGLAITDERHKTGGVTRERRLFRNVHTINDFFRQLLDEGIFKERNVVIIQYLMRAINRPDLEQMCIEYARKDHRALCYFEDSTDQGRPKVYLHVVDDIDQYTSMDSLVQTVACIVGCTVNDIEIVGVIPDSSFIIIMTMKLNLLNILKDASPLNLMKLLQFNVDWIRTEDKIINIAHPICKNIINSCSNPLPVVCAIDFGTTYSGYAYSWRPDYERNPLNIECNPPWSNGEMMTLKTPTCILFDKSENFHSFGYEAENKYRKLAEKAQEEIETDEDDDSDDGTGDDKIKEDSVTEWLYFRRFKMKLYQDDMMTKQKLKKLKLSAENGKKLSALKVFSESIRYLKNHFEDLLRKTTKRDDFQVYESSWFDAILWVLTVPAIWSDQAKQFMRDAAVQAGIKASNLVLALEPESAALLCRQLALTKRADDINIQMFEPGSKFMIVDCGGGTVDVTAYRVEKNNTLSELHCASGDAVGGTNVDKLFFELLNDIFGDDVVERFQNKSQSDWQALLRSFEVKKRCIGRKGQIEQQEKWNTFSNLGGLFHEHKMSNSQTSLSKRLQEMKMKKKIKCANPKLRIDITTLTKKVFTGPIRDIVNHLTGLFTEEDVKDIEIILIVGGFSECPLLQNEIKISFPNKRIVNPREGSIAVMKGAVLFGHSAEIIARKRIEQGQELLPNEEVSKCIVRRRSKAYYGVATDVPFIDGKHHSACKYTNEEGISMCSDIFDCLIKKNQEMEIGKTVIEKTFRSSNSSEANVEIYCSSKEALYCHEECCRKIGNIHAKFSDDAHDRRLFKVQLHFGFTETIAIAIDLKTQLAWKVHLDCIQ